MGYKAGLYGDAKLARDASEDSGSVDMTVDIKAAQTDAPMHEKWEVPMEVPVRDLPGASVPGYTRWPVLLYVIHTGVFV